MKKTLLFFFGNPVFIILNEPVYNCLVQALKGTSV